MDKFNFQNFLRLDLFDVIQILFIVDVTDLHLFSASCTQFCVQAIHDISNGDIHW